MATFGSFADLSPAQVALAQRRQASGGDILSNLIQGLQQGVQMQQAPQQLANQAIAQQLAAQLQQVKLLTAQKQLEELNKTPIQRAREAFALKQAEKAMATDSLVEGPAGFGEIGLASSVGMTAPQIAALQQASLAPQMDQVTIPTAELPSSSFSLGGQPAASGLQLQVDQLPALDQAIGQALQRQNPSFQAPSAPLRGVEREIQGLPGLYRSSAAEQDFLKREIAKQRQLELNKIRELSPGASLMSGAEGIIFTAPEKGAAPRIQVEKAGNEFITFENGKEIRRTPFKAGQDLFRSANGSFIVTPNAQGQLDSTSFELIPGTTPTSSSSGGGLKPPAAAQTDYLGYIEINRELNQTKNFVDQIQKTGKFPSSGQVALNQFLAARPEDIPGAGVIPGIDSVYASFQSQLGKAQTPESRELEARRAYIASTLIRLQAGLAQTNAEFRNIGPTTPKASDTYEQLVAKLDILTKRNLDKISDYQTAYPEFRGMTFRGLGEDTSPSQNAIEKQPGESDEQFFQRKYGG